MCDNIWLSAFWDIISCSIVKEKLFLREMVLFFTENKTIFMLSKVLVPTTNIVAIREILSNIKDGIWFY